MATWHWEHDRRLALDAAVQALRRGELVAFPMETFYALAFLPGTSMPRGLPPARSRVHQILSIDEYAPFTLAHESTKDVKASGFALRNGALKLVDRYWPGPLSLQVQDHEGHGAWVTVPGSAIPQSILSALGSPLLIASTGCAEVEKVENLPGQIDVIIDGGPTPIQQDATQVRIDSKGIEVLHEGIITKGMVFAVAGTFVLFVCTGNTCRSPMAEALFKGRLARRLGLSVSELQTRGFRVTSAGLSAYPGMPVSVEALRVAESEGMPIELGKDSSPLDSETVSNSTHIYVMTRSHRAQLVDRFPKAESKIQLLHRGGLNIADPVGGPQEVYAACAGEIGKQLDVIVEEIIEPFA